MTKPIDPSFLTGLPFGDRSHWIQPWRAYLDTPAASKLTDAVGINFNVSARAAPYAARLLARNGFRRARVEIGWGEINFDDPSVVNHGDDWRTKLTALRDNGIRPLILLNSNDGQPCPTRSVTLRTTQPALLGARTVQLDAASAAVVVPGRTGFDDGKAAGVLITAVDANGRATLSKPVPVLLPAGSYPGTTLRYRPFAPLTRPDGSADPEAAETLAGWLSYVDTVTAGVKSVLGSSDFDVEVWNEQTFGAGFLDVNNYYSPSDVQGTLDDGVILARTAALLKSQSRGLTGLRIGDGFSNQRPWDSGATMPAGVDAMDKHTYPADRLFPDFSSPDQRPINALGLADGLQGVNRLWTDAFAPSYASYFPEQPLSAIQTESLVRDIAPITTSFQDATGTVTAHGRDAAPAGGKPSSLWMTEFNMDTEHASGIGQDLTDADAEHLRAKSTLRALSAYVNKGVSNIDFYAAAGDEFGLISKSFWSKLAAGAYPGDDAGGEVLDGVRRLTAAMGDASISRPRKLSLDRIDDYAGKYQFAGDGTAAHPPLYNRDVLAFLPFQASDHRFVVPVYVMTRNMATLYRPDAPKTDTSRYDLPPERFRLTIGGTDAAKATVTATDPLTGQATPAEVVSRDGGTLVVEVEATDSPRLLTIDDGA